MAGRAFCEHRRPGPYTILSIPHTPQSSLKARHAGLADLGSPRPADSSPHDNGDKCGTVRVFTIASVTHRTLVHPDQTSLADRNLTLGRGFTTFQFSEL